MTESDGRRRAPRPSRVGATAPAAARNRNWTGHRMTPAARPDMPPGVVKAHARWDERARNRRLRNAALAFLVIAGAAGGVLAVILWPAAKPPAGPNPPATETKLPAAERNPSDPIPVLAPSSERIVPKSPLRQ